jgi:fido (protein-threonine AMPylation protein)
LGRGQSRLYDNLLSVLLDVRIGRHSGVPAGLVARALREFESTLKRVIDRLDVQIPSGDEPDADEVTAIFDVMAWVHGEWIRIHPFANGNGRTARLWANSIAMRYNLPPFVRLRPRPDAGYERACERAMNGQWRSMVQVFREMLDRHLRESLGDV